ncbi:MAG TPA: translation initiation factor 2 [Peptococcaceae bacterium]|nr:translation initiation factor 2 [Peptococcaceae bacterium]HPZ70788.1 translation initiation factor 2 [Peptococcaceae bacterium]HQD53837.1 translation initiation factor 2 [Peptococcaceae bacterium]
MPCYDEFSYYKKRILDLENQVNQLRISRRVLMNLIEKIESDKREILTQLEKEKHKLKMNNQRYAKWLMEKNSRYMQLQQSLQKTNNVTREE